MRVFAALTLPKWLAEVVAPTLPAAPDGARMVRPERWHLTLAFYGDLDDAGLSCVAARLGRRLPPKPGGAVSLVIQGGGVFAGGAAYLAVAGERDSDDARLRHLATLCGRAGLACGAPGTARRSRGRDIRFRAHITVARFRGTSRPTRDFRRALESVGSPTWAASEVELVASHLGPAPVYETLRAFPL